MMSSWVCVCLTSHCHRGVLNVLKVGLSVPKRSEFCGNLSLARFDKCSTFVLMQNVYANAYDDGPDWPRPPSCLTASQLKLPPDGARVTVAGLVILRQRPGTAKGVIFLTLEDETGVVNIIVWRKLYERFRRAVIAGRMLRVTGRIQNHGDVIHVVAEVIEDISPMLDQLLAKASPPEAEALSSNSQTG